MADECAHAADIRKVTPSALGCEECLETGSMWVHLRLCRTCGHVGCCDSSPNRHASKHFRATQHPIIEGYEFIAIAMGAFDSPTGARIAKHTFVGDKGDYYEIDDGLPQSQSY